MCGTLTIFGDNAYVSTDKVVSPFKYPTPDGGEDDYNYYHSQLRINIKCAFGILVH